MMAMRMATSMRCGQNESQASLERRARVIAFRLAHGELVHVPAWDPVNVVLYDVLELKQGWRVPPGNAMGAVPEVL